jgi:hypothetical protein
MIRFFVILAATSSFLLKSDAQTMCPVGESDEAVGGFCNKDDGDNKCKAHCEKQFGAELLKSECSAPRLNKKRECFCSLKCANGGCWGDPHCWSFDGTKFGYQSLKKYYVFKPCNKFPTLPEWEIIQTNHPWGAGPMAVLDTLDVIFPDFGLLVDVVAPKAAGEAHVLTVNRQAQTIPFRFARVRGHREEFVDINFSDPQHLHLVITTSFGLRITITSNPTGAVGPTSIYSDISVDIPRHPELKGNTCGILGLWNDDPKDDNIDSKGQPQPLDDGFSAAFGDSWLVPGSGLPSICEMDLARLAHEKHVKEFSKEHRERLRKMCQENLEQAELHSCLKDLGRPTHTIDDCVLDLSHIKDEDDQTAFLKAMVAKFIHDCPERKISFKRPSTKSCCNTADNLMPLFRFYQTNTQNHFYTCRPDEVVPVAHQERGTYRFEMIAARVAISPDDCKCNAAGFVPMYYLYAGGGQGGLPADREDHMWTQSEEEAKAFAAKGYGRYGFAFYCAKEQGHCGATEPFYRVLLNFDHFYTTSKAEADNCTNNNKNCKPEGIACYVWPALPPAKQ